MMIKMNKKTYVKPTIEVVRLAGEQLLEALSTTIKEDPIPGGGDAKGFTPETEDWNNDQQQDDDQSWR
ncbi:MAG: hypothetical protein PUF37_07080 [Prevotellaceae bacterium]|nr:hypothetical protein [Prevotellaceae bacterium]